MWYMNWRDGVLFDTHVVLAFGLMGFADHRTPVSLMAEWNQAMKRWLAVGPHKPRARWKKRARAGAASQHWWIYTVESSKERGVHAHELCVVPRIQVGAFREYARSWWERAAGMKLPKEAVFVRHMRVRNERRGHMVQTIWFKYVCKSLTDLATVTDDEGRLRNGREVFGLGEPRSEGDVIEAPRLAGVCRALSRKEQRASGFMSRWDEGRFEELFSGWELSARRERLEAEERNELMEEVFRQMNL
jgi:hypothetical protein